jgi:hypothetical protein
VFEVKGRLTLFSRTSGTRRVIDFQKIIIYRDHPVLDVRLVTDDGTPRRIKTSSEYELETETSADYVPVGEVKP